MNSVNRKVFLPPLILILVTILFSQINNNLFSKLISQTNQWILVNFGWLFSWSSFLFLILLIAIYFSPFAKIKIGGQNATPLLSKSRWFAISICTTIATGILFWGCAEPLHHYASPPIDGIFPNSIQSRIFSISTLYMHWSFTPYAIYCVAGLAFAYNYYNKNLDFSVSSLIGINSAKFSHIIDIICLYALVMGMSASLGAGIYSIIGGIEEVSGIKKSNFLIGLIGFAVIATFILSAISGLQRGIKWLSSFNIIGFLILAFYIFSFGFPFEILNISLEGIKDYVGTFVQRSTNIGSSIDQQWRFDWSVFYWANWFAWAPIASLFLGKIAKGYTVREFINFNLILPSLFAIIWMSIFSGSALHLNEAQGGTLYATMLESGEESVMYDVLSNITLSEVTIPFSILLIFLSYVTAADSNISAMSSMSTKEVETQDHEPPILIKVLWGLVIGTLTYVMLSTKGLDGIRILSVLGGFPALFIVIGAGVVLIKKLVLK